MNGLVGYKPARLSLLELFEATNKVSGALMRKLSALEMTSLLPHQRRNLSWPDFNHRAKSYFRMRVIQRREMRQGGAS